MHSQDIEIIIEHLEAVYASNAKFLSGYDAGSFLEQGLKRYQG